MCVRTLEDLPPSDISPNRRSQTVPSSVPFSLSSPGADILRGILSGWHVRRALFHLTGQAPACLPCPFPKGLLCPQGVGARLAQQGAR